MAVFTAIASAIVGAITGAGFAATFAAAGSLTVAGIATSVLAGGLAIATSKAMGVFKAPNMASARDPGVKVQLDPSTDNKVPVFYGSVLTGGLIIDAGISNSNDTMTYVIVLGEKTDAGTFSVGDQYRGDQKLNFGVGASSHIVTSVTDANATSSNDVNGKMRVRVYAGGTAASDQIFPTVVTNKVAATTMLSTINANTSYDGLVYAVFQIDYDAENGLTGIGQYTAEMTNSLNEPGAILDDYLTNSRYGAGLSSSDIDLTSIAALTSYATEQVDFTPTTGGTSQHNRWAINGMLGTYSDVFTNIDLICQSCSTFFTYNPKLGKFQVVPNREATTAEKNAAYVFDDDNVIGSIDVTSTQLYAQYNEIEAEFPDGQERDQTSTIFISTPSGDLNPNEPANKLTTRFPLCNDPARVTNLAQIDLRQSRKDLVVNLEADYEAIQSDVGDIVKLTNATYGFTNKLFRVMRVTEQEDPSGMLSVSLVLLEYDDSVYSHIDVTASSVLPPTGIPDWWTGIWGNIDYSNIANIINGNITIVDDPTSGNANLANTNGNVVGNVGLGNTNVVYPPYTPPGDPIINLPITIPNLPDIKTICTNLANMNVAGISQPGHFCYDHLPPNDEATWTPGANVTIPVPIPTPPVVDPTIPTLPIDDVYEFDMSVHFTGPNGSRTEPVTIPQIPVRYGGKITRGTSGPVQAGLQEDDVESNVSMANSATTPNTDLGQANSLINTPVTIDLGGIDYGEFSSVNSVLPFGQLGASGNELAYVSQRTITYKEIDINPTTGKHTASANADIVDVQAGEGIVATFSSAIPPNLSDNFNYTISKERANAIAVAGGLPPISATKTYLANTMTVQHFANSDLISAGGGSNRGMRVTNQDKRISRSDDYLPVIPIGSIGP